MMRYSSTTRSSIADLISLPILHHYRCMFAATGACPTICTLVLVAMTSACVGAGCGERESARTAGPKRIVVLMIGDGMGAGHLEAASLYRHGTPGRLAMQHLPVRTTMVTASLSGTTDSAAAATAMSTGVHTYNGRLAIDGDGAQVENTIEQAHRLGLLGGIVATSSVLDATPAAFSAHGDSRKRSLELARSQLTAVRPDLIAGGGGRQLEPLLDSLGATEYAVVSTVDGLADATARRVIGLFAPDALPYASDRTPASREPTLTELTRAALARLDRGPAGFFLVVEGSHIDPASHDHQLARAISETLAFDDAVAAVDEWMRGRDDVTLIVTADHECGGLEVVRAQGVGVLPDVRWRSHGHTNARVSLFARGPGAAELANAELDLRHIHQAITATLTRAVAPSPGGELLPDGRLRDLRHRVAARSRARDPGDHGALDALMVGADHRVLALGVAGTIHAQRERVIVLVDLDFGSATGPATLADATGSPSVSATAMVPGFGADVAIVIAGRDATALNQSGGATGLRGLRPPYGDPTRAVWIPVAANYGAGDAATMRDVEIHVPWNHLHTEPSPAPMTIAVVALLVTDTGVVVADEVLPLAIFEVARDTRGAVSLVPRPARGGRER